MPKDEPKPAAADETPKAAAAGEALKLAAGAEAPKPMVGVARVPKAGVVDDMTPKPVAALLALKPPIAGAMPPPKPPPATAPADCAPDDGLVLAAVGANAGLGVLLPKPKLIIGWDCGAKP